jgi:hypothetical protein
MVLRRGVMGVVRVRSQVMVQKRRATRMRLMGWRLMKKREREERAGMLEVGFVFLFVFANGKCFVY